MADPNADRYQSEGTQVAINPDTLNFEDGLDASLTASTLSVGVKAAGVANAKLGAPVVRTATEVVPVASFTDNTDATGTFATSISIPEGAVVMQAFIDEVVGFAGDTSATVTIGDGTDVDRYNTGTPSVFATADHVSAGVPSGTAYHSAAKTVTLIVTGASDFTSIVTEGNGTMRVTVFYYQSV